MKEPNEEWVNIMGIRFLLTEESQAGGHFSRRPSSTRSCRDRVGKGSLHLQYVASKVSTVFFIPANQKEENAWRT